MTTDPAVTAAAEAVTILCAADQAMIETVVAAARPIIEAEVRERIAAEIEDTALRWRLSALHAGSDRDRRMAHIDGMEYAMRTFVARVDGSGNGAGAVADGAP